MTEGLSESQHLETSERPSPSPRSEATQDEGEDVIDLGAGETIPDAAIRPTRRMRRSTERRTNRRRRDSELRAAAATILSLLSGGGRSTPIIRRLKRLQQSLFNARFTLFVPAKSFAIRRRRGRRIRQIAIGAARAR